MSIDPVVVAGGHAIAGWSQGDMGGRALLRKKDADWEVVLCAGDDLKKADLLTKAGMSHASCKALAAALAKSEASASARAAGAVLEIRRPGDGRCRAARASRAFSDTTHKP